MSVFYLNANELSWLSGPFTVFTDSPAIFGSGTFTNPTVGYANAVGTAPSVGQVKRADLQIGLCNAVGFAPSITTFTSGNQTTVAPQVGFVDADGIVPAVGRVKKASPGVGIVNVVGIAPSNVITAPVITASSAGIVNVVGFAPTLSFGTFTVRVVNPAVGYVNAVGAGSASANAIVSFWTPIDKVTNNTWVKL